MSIDTDRLGIFRGRSHDHWGWYVANPAAPEGAAEVEAVWRRHAELTNVGSAKRWVRSILPWVVGVAVFLAIVPISVWLGQFAGVNSSTVIVVVGGVGGVVFGLAAVIAVYTALSPSHAGPNPGPDRLLVLDPDVVEWITLGTPLADVWRVQRARYEIESLTGTLAAWGVTTVDDDEIDLTAPDWIRADLVAPYLVGHLRERYRAFDALAREVGFPVPARQPETRMGPPVE